MADQVAAGMLAYGIVLALFAREKTGIGQEVSTSLLGSQAWLGSLGLQAYLFYGRSLSRVSRKEAGNPLWNVYRCKDGRWICLAMLSSDRYWPDFCKAMGIEHVAKHPKFESQIQRRQNAAELVAILDNRFASQTREEWMKRLNKPELIWAPVSEYADVATDPQMIANEYIVDFEHPTHGPIKLVGMPVRLSQTPGGIRAPAPEFGQHTEEILIEEAGYSWEEIASLREEEVI
jgi:crotonobetainyl-CoA:carnitine CoA-transferase CaiB-like acyl-CoA transferase